MPIVFAFCRTAPSVRFIAFATSITGVLAFECAFRCRRSSLVHGLRTTVFFFGINLRSFVTGRHRRARVRATQARRLDKDLVPRSAPNRVTYSDGRGADSQVHPHRHGRVYASVERRDDPALTGLGDESGRFALYRKAGKPKRIDRQRRKRAGTIAWHWQASRLAGRRRPL
jgi:hypothetical protein